MRWLALRTPVVAQGPRPEPLPSYEEARAEAHTACRQLGLLFGRPVDDRDLSVGDMVTKAYVGGWEGVRVSYGVSRHG